MPHFPKPFFKKSRGLWYVEIDRKQINLGRDREEAFRRYHELMAEPKRQEVQSWLVPALVDQFLDWVQRNRSPDTYEWYRYRLQRFCDRHGQLQTKALRPFHVQQWIDGYPDLSKTSRRNYIRSIKRCLKWAQQQGYIDTNPIAHLEVPSAERRETLITENAYESLMTFVRDPGFRDLIEATWETGCRPQESLRLEARHVEFDRLRWVFPRKEAKGKKAPRIVYLNHRSAEITRNLVERFPSGTLFRNSRGKRWTTCAVNCAFDRVRIRMAKSEMKQRGEQISENAIRELAPELNPTRTSRGELIQKSDADLRCEAKMKLIARWATRNIPRYSLYALRHAWATRALKSGIDALTVAILMGHSDPSTLAKVYQHLSHDPDHLLNQANRVSGA